MADFWHNVQRHHVLGKPTDFHNNRKRMRAEIENLSFQLSKEADVKKTKPLSGAPLRGFGGKKRRNMVPHRPASRSPGGKVISTRPMLQRDSD
jgi:hypothetical protein